MYSLCMMDAHGAIIPALNTRLHRETFIFPTHLVVLIINKRGLIFWTDHILTFHREFVGKHMTVFYMYKSKLVPMPSREKLIMVFGWLVFLMHSSKGQEGAHHAGIAVSTAKREKVRFCWGLG